MHFIRNSTRNCNLMTHFSSYVTDCNFSFCKQMTYLVTGQHWWLDSKVLRRKLVLQEGEQGDATAVDLIRVQCWSRPQFDWLSWINSFTPKQCRGGVKSWLEALFRRQRSLLQFTGHVSPAAQNPCSQSQLPEQSYLSMDPINWLLFQTGS